uniref:Peptidase M28 domain-containing protein n=1 Tax=Aegilops tauschii subsp. strangulata TaxID=200361 RepID=A0A453FFK7_AEGTS
MSKPELTISNLPLCSFCRYVIIGNHRDAWTFGAVDPNSGTAAMLEIAERLSQLEKKGWRPRRTIIVCSWDAEEFALIGSTEWAEDNIDIIGSRAVAYLNVDISVFGPGGLVPRATPQLDELIQEASRMVPDPDDPSHTLYDYMIRQNPPDCKSGRCGNRLCSFCPAYWSPFTRHVLWTIFRVPCLPLAVR